MTEKKKKKLDQILSSLAAGPRSYSDLRSETEFHKSSLSGYLRELKETGYILQTAPNIYERNPDLSLDDYDCFDKDTAIEWTILFLLSKHAHPLSFEQLKEEYTNMAGTGTDKARINPVIHAHTHNKSSSVDTFRKCLKNLIEEKLVCRIKSNNQTLYKPSETTLGLTLVSEYDLYEFCLTCADTAARSSLEPTLRSLNEKIILLCYGGDDFDPSSHFLVFGRKNNLPDSLTEQLQWFMTLPFREEVMCITYIPKSGRKQTAELSVALVVYSVEQNMVYIIGEQPDQKKTIIRLDQVRSAESIPAKRNNLFHNQAYMNLFKRMWSVSTEDPVSVTVRFEDRPYIRDKVERLCKSRASASIKPYASEDGYFIYTDEVVGIGDFSRYLRGFGSSVKVLDPPQLKEIMIQSAEAIIENYREAGYEVKYEK